LSQAIAVPRSNKDPQVDEDFQNGISQRNKETPNNCLNETPKRSFLTKRIRDLRSPTEILLAQQVELFQDQLNVMQGILAEMKRRNSIEEEKLNFKRAK